LDLVAQAIYDFVWNEFCDWYLEIAKVQIQTGSESQQRATRRTLIRTLETVLRLAHPIIPFITEELWQTVSVVAARRDAAAVTSVAVQRYPLAQLDKIDEVAEAGVARLKEFVDAARNLRGEMGISPAQRVPCFVLGDADFVVPNVSVLSALAKLSEVKVFASEAEWRAAAGHAPVAVSGEARLALYVQVDVGAEKARLTKEIARLEAELVKCKTKLSNEAFTAKAPAAVLEQERARQVQFGAALEKNKTQLARLG
jgi:valyl-tRNA synthetase